MVNLMKINYKSVSRPVQQTAKLQKYSEDTRKTERKNICIAVSES